MQTRRSSAQPAVPCTLLRLRNDSTCGIVAQAVNKDSGMAEKIVWMLEEARMTISPPLPGQQAGLGLDGQSQGTGIHLNGRTITFNSAAFVQTRLDDTDNDFEDNDASQTLLQGVSLNGVAYAPGARVEAEYTITLTNPATGESWTAYAFNINDSNPAFGTVEGLLLRPNANGTFPPTGVALVVSNAGEGPGGVGSNPYDLYDTPPCFTPGTLIDTASGPRPIEDLRPGDLVKTRDHGLQPLRWIGRATLTPAHLALYPEHLPVRFAAGSLGHGLPLRPLLLSPQHRLLVTGWKAELLFAQDEVLVPATALRNDNGIRCEAAPGGVTYLHLLFDRHEIVYAEGVAVESLHAPWLLRAPLPPALRAELEALFPGFF
ncbi:MAG: hypothetical protein EAZ40_12080 [Rhodobacterales bacterium]|nr:MAG: hypothetical protein EAZ40_12080 [Rhodobacterales bacterium]